MSKILAGAEGFGLGEGSLENPGSPARLVRNGPAGDREHQGGGCWGRGGDRNGGGVGGAGEPSFEALDEEDTRGRGKPGVQDEGEKWGDSGEQKCLRSVPSQARRQ